MDFRMTLEVELDERYTIPRPPISWRSPTHSLGEVVQKFDLPQVVQCDVKQCPVSIYNVNFDLTQPLLLCLNRTIRKICARNLTFDKREKALREIGEPVLIPKDYKGRLDGPCESRPLPRSRLYSVHSARYLTCVCGDISLT